MITKGLFYLGPLGYIVELPSVARGSNPDASPVRIGGRHIALSGRITDDLFGIKRVWNLTWTYRTEAELRGILAPFQRLIRDGYRMIDTRRANHLAVNIAATGGVYRSARGFETSGAGAVSQFEPTPPDELAGVLDSAIKMNGHAANDYLWATGEQLALIEGSEYRFSVWLKGSGNARPVIDLENFGVLTGSTVALTGTWQRVEMVGTADAADRYGTVGIQGLSAASEVHVMGMMVQVDSPLGDWEPGSGCPEVTVSKMQHSYPYVGLHAITATIQEV